MDPIVEKAAEAAYERIRLSGFMVGVHMLTWEAQGIEVRAAWCQAQRAAIASLREPSEAMMLAAAAACADAAPARVEAEMWPPDTTSNRMALAAYVAAIDAALAEGEP